MGRTGEHQGSSETEAAMRADRLGEHGRRQRSLATRTQSAAVGGDGGDGTGGQVNREERA